MLRAENSDRYWAARSGKKTVQASTQVNLRLNRWRSAPAQGPGSSPVDRFRPHPAAGLPTIGRGSATHADAVGGVQLSGAVGAEDHDDRDASPIFQLASLGGGRHPGGSGVALEESHRLGQLDGTDESAARWFLDDARRPRQAGSRSCP